MREREREREILGIFCFLLQAEFWWKADGKTNLDFQISTRPSSRAGLLDKLLFIRYEFSQTLQIAELPKR
jgi:hypothetical protein